jgi:hypothetical protein
VTTDLTDYFTALREKLDGNDLEEHLHAVDERNLFSDQLPACVVALEAFVEFTENGFDGGRTSEGVYIRGVTDVELTPGGTYKLSQARALLDQIRERVRKPADYSSFAALKAMKPPPC